MRDVFSSSAQTDSASGLPQAAMWVLVSLYHWGSAGHEVVNLKMVLDACSKAATYQDGFRLVVSVAGESRGVSSSVMAPAMLQTVSGRFESYGPVSDFP